MKLIDLLTYRGTLILLNTLGLLGVVWILIAAGKAPPALVVAYACGFVAFATPRRHKLLLVLALITSLLLLVLGLPFTYFAVENGIGLGWFTVLVMAVFVVPLLTAFACWARWPRAVI